MAFRNATFYRFPTSMDFSQAESAFGECALKPVGPFELESRGFVSPYGRGETTLVAQFAAPYLWFTLGLETKILPSAVVHDLLQKKIAQVEAERGTSIGGRARRQIKEDLIHDLLPTVLVRPTRVDAMIDLESAFIAIDTTSRRLADAVVSEVRRAFGSFPATPLCSERDPRSIFTAWLAEEGPPAGILLGDTCELRSPAVAGPVVRCTSVELQGEEVRKHLEAGLLATRLGLNVSDRISFVAGSDLVMRRIRLLDVDAIDDEEGPEDVAEARRAAMDSEFVLTSGELRRAFLALDSVLRFNPGS